MSEIIISAFADEAANDLAGQIQALRANQVTHLELRAVDQVNVADFTQEKTAAVRSALDDAGIRVSCLATPLGKIDITDPMPPHLEKLRRLCATAAAFDCQRLRIFSFYIPHDQPAALYREAVLERLDQMIEIAAAAGVRLLHENEKDIYGDIMARCLDLHQAFGDRLGAILDPANYVQVGSDPLLAMNELDPWIEYLHIKDCRRSDGRIVPAGQGDGQVDAVIRRYLSRAERRHIAIEPHLFAFDGLSGLEKGLASLPGGSHEVGVGGSYADGPSAFAAGIRAFRTVMGPAVAR